MSITSTATIQTASRVNPGTTFTVDPNPPNPPTPPLKDDHQWITAYLTIHQLSTPSYRYMYIFWLVVVLIFIVFAALHWTGQRGGALGGLWSKWSLRRRTWRKRHRMANARHKQPLALPSNAQLLALALLYIATFLLCFLGPDYIAPGIHVWDLTHTNSPRAIPIPLNPRVDRVPNPTAASQPNYSIPKAWWTAGGRTGTMAFALFPLCVLFALKSPPFALFAIPFMIQLYNDKLAFLHRWTGRLIWIVTALHVALWGVQLSLDKRSVDDSSSVWTFAFGYDKFVFGWLGFICLTLLTALSLRPVRLESYELFYFIHALLIPLTLAFSALHFPPIGWWCWAALAIWVGERLWRLVRFLRINGIIGGIRGNRNVRLSSVNEKASGRLVSPTQLAHARKISSAPAHARGVSGALQDNQDQSIPPTEMYATDVNDGREFDPTRSRVVSTGQETIRTYTTGSSVELMSHAAHPAVRTSQPDFSQHGYIPPPIVHLPFQSAPSGVSLRKIYVPPLGYAHASLLPGRTIRLRIIPPRRFTWAPGQHVLLTVPSVSKFSSHPFTIASICDSEAQSDEGRQIVILVRARTGFTKDLWSHIEQLEDAGRVGDVPVTPFLPPKTGVLLRAYLDGPFGSSIRTRWTSYSTVLVIAGGSGASFAVAVLEYACRCMAGRNGKLLGGKTGGWGHHAISQISRVRLVWIIREYSHIQWVASVLRRCMDMVPRTALQIDIFVTNVVAKPTAGFSSEMHPSRDFGNSLVPPSPHFSRPGKAGQYSNSSDISLNSTISSNGFTGASGAGAPPTESDHGTDLMDIVEMYGGIGHEEHELDLTNFDGEDDTRLPGERQLSYRLKKEGKIRRAKTKSERAVLTKLQPDRPTAGIKLPPVQQAHHTSNYDRSGFTSRAPSRDFVWSPTTPESVRSPTVDDSHHPLSPGSSSLSPVTPQSYRSNAFLYANPGEVSRSSSPVPSTKSDAVTMFDSITKRPPRSMGHLRRPSKFDIDEAEAEDMPVVAERARPGRAKVDRIVADEVGRSRGAIVVACCGPTSLNAMVRKCVAAQIDPSRILRGDARASITLVSEDFEW